MDKILYCPEECRDLNKTKKITCKKYSMDLELHFPNIVRCFPCRNNGESNGRECKS